MHFSCSSFQGHIDGRCEALDQSSFTNRARRVIGQRFEFDLNSKSRNLMTSQDISKVLTDTPKQFEADSNLCLRRHCWHTPPRANATDNELYCRDFRLSCASCLKTHGFICDLCSSGEGVETSESSPNIEFLVWGGMRRSIIQEKRVPKGAEFHMCKRTEFWTFVSAQLCNVHRSAPC